MTPDKLQLTTSADPPIIDELAQWCVLGVGKGRETRNRRVPVLLREFNDLIDPVSRIITVAGTSGKGTTCTLLEAALVGSGHTPGTYTKPHLYAYRERISIGGHWVTNAELEAHTARLLPRLRAFVETHGTALHPSLYECLMLIAFSIFNAHGVTVAIIEASIGGANDASSHLPSTVSLLTSVDLDHQTELGDTIEEIARDKAGIAPPGSTLVVGAGIPETVQAIVRDECDRRGVAYRLANAEAVWTGTRFMDWQRVGIDNHYFELHFAHPQQLLNVATVYEAMQVLRGLKWISNLNGLTNITNARLPGRFEHVAGSPAWVFDVAHNLLSIRSLILTALPRLPADQVVVLLGATEPHDYRGMVQLLAAWGARLAFCSGFTRAVPAETLAASGPDPARVAGVFASPQEAVAHFVRAREYAEDTILVTGSLFLVGQCRVEVSRHGLPIEMER